MKLLIDDIKNAPNARLDITFSDYVEGFNLKDKVFAELTASACGFVINIRGRIQASLILQCDRCLNEYVYVLDTDINEDFTTESIVPEDHREFELGENDFVEELTGKTEIDVTDLIYQSIILELPYKSLCSEDCEGLTIENKTEYIDERLEVFKSFSENSLSNKKEGK